MDFFKRFHLIEFPAFYIGRENLYFVNICIFVKFCEVVGVS